MFYGRENANYIHANRYPVAAAQNLPQHSIGEAVPEEYAEAYTISIPSKISLNSQATTVTVELRV